jgi:hypothetical protein
VKAQETSVQALIQGEKQFQVPLYQRIYSGQEQKLRELWSDILDQAEVLASNSPAPTLRTSFAATTQPTGTSEPRSTGSDPSNTTS